MNNDEMAMGGRPLTDILRDIGNGQFIKDATGQLNSVVAACQETRKNGGLVIKVAIMPTGRGTFKLVAKCEAKIPTEDALETTFFVTPEGTLLRDDPNQPKLPLRVVNDQSQERPRQVIDPTTGEILA